GGDGVLLAVKHPGGTGVGQHLRGHGAALHHAAVGGQIAPEDLQSAGGGVGILDGPNGVVVEVLDPLNVLAHGLAGDGQAVQIQKTALGQLRLDSRDAAGRVQVRHVGGARRGQVAQVGGLLADLVEQGQVHRAARLLGDGQQVQHRVGGAAQGHVAGQGVADAAGVDDVPCADVPADHLHDGGAGPAAQLQPLAVHRGDGAVARQADADGLAQAVHGVGGVHAGAAAAAGTAVLGAVLQLLGGDHACLVGAHSLEHLGEADLLAVVGAGQHGAAAAHHGGHVHPHRRHHHAGDDLVTVGHQHTAVKLVSHEHGLHTVADQLPA
ncbi:Glycerate dehydrogenase, partial [Dysosmobacter welbionis]